MTRCSRYLVSFVVILFSQVLLAQSPIAEGPPPGRETAPSEDAARQAVATPKAQPPRSESPALRLGTGDEMDISVFGIPEMNQHARVSTEGNIYFAPLGWVPVSGLTVDEAQARLQSRLVEGGFLTHPHVVIAVKEYTSQEVSVIGEVAKPGVYPVLGPHTLLDMLLAAGGLGQKAGNTVTITHRDHADEPVKVKIGSDLQPENANVTILPGDVVSVSRAGIVYVVGEVNRPGGFVMENEKMKLAEAIALAAGPTRAASLKGAKMLRKSPNGGLEEISVPLKKVLQAKAPDVDLQPNDIIFVPASLSKSIGSHVGQQALAMAGMVAIYRP